MTTRRLAAILAADVVGFSSMMERDEEGTLRLLKITQRDLIEPRVREHHGRIVKTTGDGFLIEFGSPLDAIRCALEVYAPAHSSLPRGPLGAEASGARAAGEDHQRRAELEGRSYGAPFCRNGVGLRGVERRRPTAHVPRMPSVAGGRCVPSERCLGKIQSAFRRDGA
jgi:class 3 adenylate cyclase